MAISGSNTFGRIRMDDGTEYEIKVTYSDDAGNPVEFKPGSAPSLFDSNPASKQKLHALIKSAAQAHLNHIKKSAKDLKVIHLTDAGAKLDSINTSHDVPALDPTQAAVLNNNYHTTYTKVSELWRDTAALLVENYTHYAATAYGDSIEAPVSFAPSSPAPATHADVVLTRPEATAPPSSPLGHTPATPSAPPSPDDEKEVWADARESQPSKPASFLARASRAVLNGLHECLHPEAPPVDLGQLPANFDLSPFNTTRPQLLTHTTTQLPDALDGFINTLYDKTHQHGFGAYVQAIEDQYTQLVEEMNALTIAEEQKQALKLTIANHFKNAQWEHLKKYYKNARETSPRLDLNPELDAAWARLTKGPIFTAPSTDPITQPSFNLFKKDRALLPKFS